MSKIFQCQICSKAFHSKSSISRHERQLHPNNRTVPHGFLLDKTDWYERRHPDPNLLTISYVLMQEQETKYKVIFGWKLKNYIDTDETLYHIGGGI
ncbi:hypothetical protein C1645_831407 [Glomus cerebriforme]|uniref:C2H2-type domain-containing protein n=1 Tax=Glomus cerebriforme TaxID=658196 RepID=A0A397SK81_9GLOM|nr:hypothetical protein C1645_831407 [Glomus cerebriforme]